MPAPDYVQRNYEVKVVVPFPVKTVKTEPPPPIVLDLTTAAAPFEAVFNIQ